MVEKQLDKPTQTDAHSGLATAAAALHADAYADRPSLLTRTWNVTKSIASGAADRLSDDVMNFSDHPWRSTAEIAGTAAGAGLAIACSVEFGAAVATYAGLAKISIQVGALFGAETAVAIIGPGAQALTSKTASDWKNTAAARDIVADPASHTPEQIASAQTQIGQTLGRDALANAALYGGFAVGAAGAEFASRATAARTPEVNATGDVPSITPKAAANDNISSGIRKDAQGNLLGHEWGKDSFNLRYDKRTGKPNAISFWDGANHRGFYKPYGSTGDTWQNPEYSFYKANVSVDNKVGVRVIHEGEEFKFGADGKQTIERFSGYKEVADVRYSGVPGVEYLKLPNDGPEIIQEKLPDGQSKLTMTLNERTYTSEAGNSESGWEFKAPNGHDGPGDNGTASTVKLTNDDPNPQDNKRGWSVSMVDSDGNGTRTFGRSGYQQSSFKDGESTTSQQIDSSGRVIEAEIKNGNMTSKHQVWSLGGRQMITDTFEVPGAKVIRHNGFLSLEQDGVRTDVSNFKELRDPNNSGRSGLSVDMPDGTAKIFWSDGAHS